MKLESANGRNLWLYRVEADGTVTRRVAYTPDKSKPTPQEFKITGIYPNPFNSSVTVKLQIPSSGTFAFSICDVTGRLIDQVEQGFEHGTQRFTWHPGNDLASGVYFLQVRANCTNEKSRVVKLISLR